jgi:hypothetical protein
MADELGWDAARTKAEVEHFKKQAKRLYAVPEQTGHGPA